MHADFPRPAEFVTVYYIQRFNHRTLDTVAMTSLPESQKALIQHVYAQPLQLETIPVPKPGPGSAIIKLLHANVISYMRDVYDGSRKYEYAVPLVPGTAAVGRIAAVGPDSTSLQVGQLVLFDPTIRSRDEPSDIMLSGMAQGGSAGSLKLMHGEWRDSSYAEYFRAPLENCFRMDEEKLLRLGYEIGQLAYLFTMLVPYGGLRAIDVRPGETVVVAPATGQFGGGAVITALAMGARVVAMGRNEKALVKLKEFDSRVETVRIVGNMEKEMAELAKFGPFDAFFDISPAEAQNSTHFKSCILSLSHSGRVSLMGGLKHDLPIPHRAIMRKNLTLKGTWMCDRSDIISMIKMVEHGQLKLDFVRTTKFGLEDWAKAFDHASEHTGLGEVTLLEPGSTS